MVIVVFSTSAKANYDVDILGGSIPGIPAQRLGVPQEVAGRSHVKINRSFFTKTLFVTLLFIFRSPLLCASYSHQEQVLSGSTYLYDEIIHLPFPLT